MKLPDQVKAAIERIHAAGYEAYIVGGAVRDYAMDRPIHDWDIATSARPRETEAVFSDCKIIETGLKHGTVTIVLNGMPLEITTYRVDGDYTDHRRPDSVKFTGSLQEDLRRRDFTMNAMAWHPRTGIVDPAGGLQDIRQGLLRCVGEPERRFDEDGLRILRALRFASVYELQLEPATAAAVHRKKEQLRDIAAERVQMELSRMLCGKGVRQILLQYGDVMSVVLPEMAPMADFVQRNSCHGRDAWAHTALAAASVPPETELRWAALLRGVGKGCCFSGEQNGAEHFCDQTGREAKIADGVMRRLRFSNASRSCIAALIRYHDLPIEPDKKQIARLLNQLGKESLRRLLLLQKADTIVQSDIDREKQEKCRQAEALLEELLAEKICFSMQDLAVNGRDMLALGLQGPAVGRALQGCLEAVLEQELPNERRALLEWAEKNR